MAELIRTSHPPPAHETVQFHAMPQPSIPEQYLYKNRLQHYTQILSLPLPVYETKKEGVAHAPVFRATVVVDNTKYTSPKVFTNIKSAEQDVAKIALDAVMRKVKDEGSPIIREDAIFCKAVLNEYSAKMHINMPSYQTTQKEEGLPAFATSLVFDGVTFTGPVARTKKAAEQLAARTAILSIMGNPGPNSALISNIAKSKYQPYACLMKVNCSNNTNNVVTPLVNTGELTTGSPLNKRKEIVNFGVMSRMPAVIENPCGQIATVPVPNQPLHEFKRPKMDTPTALPDPMIEFVPSVYEQPSGAGRSAKKRRKKAKKNHQHNAQFPYPVAPPNHLPLAIPQ